MLGLAKLTTEQLISEYYRERLTEQASIAVAEFGVLEVRVYFRYDTLCIEVFCARDVIPLDPNGNKIFSLMFPSSTAPTHFTSISPARPGTIKLMFDIPSGLSDPYVIVELLPKWVFPSCQERSTSVQKATLNPQFEETFEL